MIRMPVEAEHVARRGEAWGQDGGVRARALVSLERGSRSLVLRQALAGGGRGCCGPGAADQPPVAARLPHRAVEKVDLEDGEQDGRGAGGWGALSASQRPQERRNGRGGRGAAKGKRPPGGS